MTSSKLNENDILKAIVRKGAVADICKEFGSSPSPHPGKGKQEALIDETADQQKAQLRQIAKIWTALSKLIRSQCNKGRVIDSLYFGSFAKTVVMGGDDLAKTYTYCPGPRAIFTLFENAENVRSVSQEVSSSVTVLVSRQTLILTDKP